MILQPNDDNNDMKIQNTFQNSFALFFRGINYTDDNFYTNIEILYPWFY